MGRTEDELESMRLSDQVVEAMEVARLDMQKDAAKSWADPVLVERERCAKVVEAACAEMAEKIREGA